MVAEIGLAATVLALVAAIYAFIAALVAQRSHYENLAISARNAVLTASLMLLVAVAMLLVGLLHEHYEIAYVWMVTSPGTPPFYRLTALWGSQAGSLLFWSLLMSTSASIAVFGNWRSHRRLILYSIAWMMAVLIFFLSITLIHENPFERWWLTTAEDGQLRYVQALFAPLEARAPNISELALSARGLNPLLRHFGMALHPPMLYLGFVGLVIPFAFAMAALASGDLSTNWIKASRRWMMVAWMFLTLGLLLGGRWAYDVLGWGGYWNWDPVQNAAFLPWLLGTAFLHSAVIQEKRGMLKTWNMLLATGTFSAALFATFATRSGFVESVHAFARGRSGEPLLLFWLIVTMIALGLTRWRFRQGALESDHEFGSILSREVLFVINNVVFVALFAAIFWGSFVAPMIASVTGRGSLSLSSAYFETVTAPLFLVMYILMAIAPAAAWGSMAWMRLGRALALPLGLSVLTALGFALSGMQQAGALVAFFAASFAAWVVVVETLRGYRTRKKNQRTSAPLTIIWELLTRNSRRYGGYLIHFGVALIGIGIIGSSVFQQETQGTLQAGESLRLGGYELRFEQFHDEIVRDGIHAEIAQLTIWQDGTQVAMLEPGREVYPGIRTQIMTVAAAHSTLAGDLYVILADWQQDGSLTRATFKVYFNPLINLIWLGGLLLIAGTIWTVLPRIILPAHARQELWDASARPLAGQISLQGDAG